MPEARVFRRAGRGKSAAPVRRGESEARPRLSLTLLLYRLGLEYCYARILSIGRHFPRGLHFQVAHPWSVGR